MCQRLQALGVWVLVPMLCVGTAQGMALKFVLDERLKSSFSQAYQVQDGVGCSN